MENMATVIGILTGIIALVSAGFGAAKYLKTRGKNAIKSHFSFRPTWPDGTVFNYNTGKNYFTYFKRNQVIHAYPEALIVVRNQRQHEEINVAPFLVIRLLEVQSFPENCDFFILWGKGGPERLNIAKAILSPTQKQVTTAPVVEIESGTQDGINPIKIPYYSLVPEEAISFLLHLDMVPGYIYRIQVGVLFSEGHRQHIDWNPQVYNVGIPQQARCWISAHRLTLNRVDRWLSMLGLINPYERMPFSPTDSAPEGYKSNLKSAEKFHKFARKLLDSNRLFNLSGWSTFFPYEIG